MTRRQTVTRNGDNNLVLSNIEEMVFTEAEASKQLKALDSQRSALELQVRTLQNQLDIVTSSIAVMEQLGVTREPGKVDMVTVNSPNP